MVLWVVTAATDAHDARLGRVQIMMLGCGGILGCNCGAHDSVRSMVTAAHDAAWVVTATAGAHDARLVRCGWW